MSAIPPLLARMEGKKSRSRKSPFARPKECQLQCDVAAALKDHVLPEWRWSHFPAGEQRDVITGARLKRMGLQRGWPDFQLISPGGLYHGLELKRIGEVLTDDQESFHFWSIRNNIAYSIVYTFDEALRVLDHRHCLRVRIGGQPIMFILVSGSLWRDPAARVSKNDKQFVTCLLKSGTQTEPLWVNIVCFDNTAQSELLRLKAGDAVSVQGTAKIGVFEKNGEYHANLEVVAAHVLALRQPPKSAKPKQRDASTKHSNNRGAADFDDSVTF